MIKKPIENKRENIPLNQTKIINSKEVQIINSSRNQSINPLLENSNNNQNFYKGIHPQTQIFNRNIGKTENEEVANLRYLDKNIIAPPHQLNSKDSSENNNNHHYFKNKETIQINSPLANSKIHGNNFVMKKISSPLHLTTNESNNFNQSFSPQTQNIEKNYYSNMIQQTFSPQENHNVKKSLIQTTLQNKFQVNKTEENLKFKNQNQILPKNNSYVQSDNNQFIYPSNNHSQENNNFKKDIVQPINLQNNFQVNNTGEYGNFTTQKSFLPENVSIMQNGNNQFGNYASNFYSYSPQENHKDIIKKDIVQPMNQNNFKETKTEEYSNFAKHKQFLPEYNSLVKNNNNQYNTYPSNIPLFSPQEHHNISIKKDLKEPIQQNNFQVNQSDFKNDKQFLSENNCLNNNNNFSPHQKFSMENHKSIVSKSLVQPNQNNFQVNQISDSDNFGNQQQYLIGSHVDNNKFNNYNFVSSPVRNMLEKNNNNEANKYSYSLKNYENLQYSEKKVETKENKSLEERIKEALKQK